MELLVGVYYVLVRITTICTRYVPHGYFYKQPIQYYNIMNLANNDKQNNLTLSSID